GGTLWVILTGKPPFNGTPAEVMHPHLHAPLPLERLKGVPQPIVVLLEAHLEKDPRWRLQSPSEFLEAIPIITGAITAGLPVSFESELPAFAFTEDNMTEDNICIRTQNFERLSLGNTTLRKLPEEQVRAYRKAAE